MNRRTRIIALVAMLVACSTAKQAASDGQESAHAAPAAREVPAAQAADTATGERATIIRLEAEARALAKVTGCTSVRACRSAPVGAKACGGPRTFITYCAATTDTVALLRTLHELERVEKAWNEHSGMMSTCELRVAPAVTLVGGSCQESSTGAGLERAP